MAAAPPTSMVPPGSRSMTAFLQPLGCTRGDAWLCDLLPESRTNPSQAAATVTRYAPWVERGIAPAATVPDAPRRFTDEARREAITGELRRSQAQESRSSSLAPVSPPDLGRSA